MQIIDSPAKPIVEGSQESREPKSRWTSVTGAHIKANRFQYGIVVLMFALSAVLVVSLFVWRNSSLQTFNFLFAYLPLTLPILTVALTVVLRPHELVDLNGWLRLTTTFSLGLVSFAIWAFVASQSVSQYIVINAIKVFNKDHAVLLVLIAFTWASSCSIITALAERAERKRLWQFGQAVQFAVSLTLCFALPYLLLEDKATVEKNTGQSFDTRQFIVNIPYRDASLNQHLGRTTDPVTECFVARHVSAKGRVEAIQKATELMDQEDLVFRARGSSSDPRKPIEVLESLIVAQEER